MKLSDINSSSITLTQLTNNQMLSDLFSVNMISFEREEKSSCMNQMVSLLMVDRLEIKATQAIVFITETPTGFSHF